MPLISIGENILTHLLFDLPVQIIVSLLAVDPIGYVGSKKNLIWERKIVESFVFEMATFAANKKHWVRNWQMHVEGRLRYPKKGISYHCHVNCSSLNIYLIGTEFIFELFQALLFVYCSFKFRNKLLLCIFIKITISIWFGWSDTDYLYSERRSQ